MVQKTTQDKQRADPIIKMINNDTELMLPKSECNKEELINPPTALALWQ